MAMAFKSGFADTMAFVEVVDVKYENLIQMRQPDEILV
jgi:hypothetical protein